MTTLNLTLKEEKGEVMCVMMREDVLLLDRCFCDDIKNNNIYSSTTYFTPQQCTGLK